MRKLGNILIKTKNKLIVVKSTINNPERIIGTEVYSSELKKIGYIIDVIGRTGNPYIVVKPESLNIIDQLGFDTVLYYHERRKPVRKTPGRRVSKRYK